MKIAVIGTGGVGGYFGGRLADAGHEVTFVARGSHLKALQQNGLRVDSILGDFEVASVQATDSMETVAPVDVVLVCTKADQLSDVVPQLSSMIQEETMVIPLQNGVLATEVLRAHVPEPNVLSGMCQIISKIEAPGYIKHVGIDPIMQIGEPGGGISERVLKVQQVFQTAKINLLTPEDIRAELWKKFILICVGGLVAVGRSSYGAMREHTESRKLIESVIQEGINVAKSFQVNIPDNFLEDRMRFIDSFPYETDSSMCRDIWAGRPSELETKNGAMVKLGAQQHIPTPVNDFIYGCLLPLEKKARE